MRRQIQMSNERKTHSTGGRKSVRDQINKFVEKKRQSEIENKKENVYKYTTKQTNKQIYKK